MPHGSSPGSSDLPRWLWLWAGLVALAAILAVGAFLSGSGRIDALNSQVREQAQANKTLSDQKDGIEGKPREAEDQRRKIEKDLGAESSAKEACAADLTRCREQARVRAKGQLVTARVGEESVRWKLSVESVATTAVPVWAQFYCFDAQQVQHAKLGATRLIEPGKSAEIEEDIEWEPVCHHLIYVVIVWAGSGADGRPIAVRVF